MNAIIDYLDALTRLGASTDQHAFFVQQRKDARPVDVVSIASVLSCKNIVAIERVIGIAKRQCYRNASLFVNVVSNFHADLGPCKYVEGFVVSPGLFPIEHAFVKIGDRYFDPTFELALGEDVSKSEYVSLVEIGIDELGRIEAETGVYGGIYRHKYIKRLQGRKTAKAGK